jgi:hypothetical protein
VTEGEGGNTNSGSDWTADEIAVLVGSYFLMLAEERAGRPYNKSAYRRDVIEVIGRAHGAIERKLQNVSAVLDEIGVRWIQGYKPLDHYQDLLIEAVDGHLLKNPEFLDFRAAAPMHASDDVAVLVAAPAFADTPSQARPLAIRRLVGKFDPAARDARNRALGRAGEEFVVGFERRRLERHRRGRRCSQDPSDAVDGPFDQIAPAVADERIAFDAGLVVSGEEETGVAPDQQILPTLTFMMCHDEPPQPRYCERNKNTRDTGSQRGMVGIGQSIGIYLLAFHKKLS